MRRRLAGDGVEIGDVGAAVFIEFDVGLRAVDFDGVDLEVVDRARPPVKLEVNALCGGEPVDVGAESAVDGGVDEFDDVVFSDAKSGQRGFGKGKVLPTDDPDFGVEVDGHRRFVDRASKGSGNVDDLRYHQLRGLRCGDSELSLEGGGRRRSVDGQCIGGYRGDRPGVDTVVVGQCQRGVGDGNTRILVAEMAKQPGCQSLEHLVGGQGVGVVVDIGVTVVAAELATQSPQVVAAVGVAVQHHVDPGQRQLGDRGPTGDRRDEIDGGVDLVDDHQWRVVAGKGHLEVAQFDAPQAGGGHGVGVQNKARSLLKVLQLAAENMARKKRKDPPQSGGDDQDQRRDGGADF